MQKSTLRTDYKKKRKQLSPHQRQEWSEKICDSVIRHHDFNHKTISLFLPIRQLAEVDTTPLFMHLQSLQNTKIALSVSGLEDFSMRHRLWSPDVIIKDNSWGIPEPTSGTTVENTTIDMILVPMLVCDRNGYRVGYGKGFYDRFIAQCRDDVALIGVNFFPPVDRVDHNTTDIAIDILHTPDKVYAFK